MRYNSLWLWRWLLHRMLKKWLPPVNRLIWQHNRNVIWRRESAKKRINSTSSSQFAALPLVKPVVSFAHTIINWHSCSVAKSAWCLPFKKNPKISQFFFQLTSCNFKVLRNNNHHVPMSHDQFVLLGQTSSEPWICVYSFLLDHIQMAEA